MNHRKESLFPFASVAPMIGLGRLKASMEKDYAMTKSPFNLGKKPNTAKDALASEAEAALKSVLRMDPDGLTSYASQDLTAVMGAKPDKRVVKKVSSLGPDIDHASSSLSRGQAFKKKDWIMGQLEDEIEDASRGRKVSVGQADHADLDRRMKETEESFEKVNQERPRHPKRR